MAFDDTIITAKRIADMMTAQDMSYGKLAELTGIHKSTLQRYVTGKVRKIPLYRIELIAEALGSSTAQLLGWVDTDDELIQPATPDSSREVTRRFLISLDILNPDDDLTDDLLNAIIYAARATARAIIDRQ